MKFLNATLIVVLLLLTITAKSQVVINEYSCSNVTTITDNFGNYEDWIELYNTSSSAINLSGYYLSDKINNPTKWAFPAGSVIGGNSHLLIWASKKNTVVGSNIHTNFSLTQCTPDAIIFSDAIGNVLDSLTLKRTQQDHSRGRTTDGASTWSVFLNPTPNTSNANAYKEYEPLPTFGLAPGFYTGSQSISIADLDPTAIIRYTTDGSNPTTSSALYTTPISVTNTTIIKAAAWSSSGPLVPKSFIEPNTYFINVSYTLPVVSFGSLDLDTLIDQGFSMHQVQDASMEYFNANKNFKFQQVGSANKHGNDSWAYSQRGFDYVMADEQGYDNQIDYKLFPNVTQRKKFGRIILKAAASDNYPGNGLPSCHLRDAFVQSFSQWRHFDLDCRSWTPCILFLNGQYWGVYEIREKVDDNDYTNYYYNQNTNDLDFLQYWGGLITAYGSDTSWTNTYNFAMTNSLTNNGAFNYVMSKVDASSAIDNMVYNTFIVDSDWIDWNTMWWRGRNTAGKKLKWRYALWDEDNTYNLGQNFTGWPTTNSTANPCDLNLTWGSLTNPPVPEEGHVALFNAMMQNNIFKTQFINRYADMLNHDLNCDTILYYLQSRMLNVLTPEMPGQINRWGGTMTQWQNNVDTMIAFIKRRCTYMDSSIINCYSVTGPFHVAFDVYPHGKGKLKINTIQPGYYPYDGNYFGGVYLPVVETALDTCWHFDHWKLLHHSLSADTLTNDTLFVNLNADDSIVAVYVNYCGPKPPLPINDNIFIPSAFSPNGDGINDVFKISGKNINSINLKIFNRWGMLVFESNDVNNVWDGKFQGADLQSGVYVYTAYIRNNDGTEKQTSGNILLLK